jgi:hypothetical protein
MHPIELQVAGEQTPEKPGSIAGGHADGGDQAVMVPRLLLPERPPEGQEDILLGHEQADGDEALERRCDRALGDGGDLRARSPAFRSAGSRLDPTRDSPGVLHDRARRVAPGQDPGLGGCEEE